MPASSPVTAEHADAIARCARAMRNSCLLPPIPVGDGCSCGACRSGTAVAACCVGRRSGLGNSGKTASKENGFRSVGLAISGGRRTTVSPDASSQMCGSKQLHLLRFLSRDGSFTAARFSFEPQLRTWSRTPFRLCRSNHNTSGGTDCWLVVCCCSCTQVRAAGCF